jgi:RNA polymerase sigma-70 factor (ECF subfamily)
MDGEPTSEPPWDEYREYLALIARILLQPKFRCKVDSSDVVQDALLKAYGGWHQYKGTTEAERRAWLRKILSNTIMDHYRTFTGSKKNINLEQSFEATLDQTSARLEEWIADSSDGPDGRMMKEELLDQLARALNHLPENQQTAVELFYIREYSVARIGEEMGLSKKAVGGLIERGIKAIRKAMNDVS